MKKIQQSKKLSDVCYDIRGPVLEKAKELEEEGNQILKLNIGNPGAFGFDAHDEILQSVIANLRDAQGYSDAKGIFPARKAIMQDCQKNGIQNVEIDDIYLGNCVSELIATALQALVNTDDEVLVPAPDYPLWTAAVSLCGGNPVHYTCDEKANWYPDIDDIRKKISPRTKALVIINPNNPTGSVYSKDLLLSLIEIARKNQLIVFADEIYSKIVYEDVQHLPVASLCEDVFVVSFNGLSKSYRLAGFRSGWMILHGPKAVARDYIEGLNILASMRLCANVPAQFAVQTALGGYQSINDLVMPKGRLEVQREKMWMLLNEISGVSCVKPMGAIYMFVGIDPKKYKINDDEELVLRLLQREHLLVVQGSAFNIKDSQHLRLVFLPRTEQIEIAVEKFARVLDSYR